MGLAIRSGQKLLAALCTKPAETQPGIYSCFLLRKCSCVTRGYWRESSIRSCRFLYTAEPLRPHSKALHYTFCNCMAQHNPGAWHVSLVCAAAGGTLIALFPQYCFHKLAPFAGSAALA